MAHVESSLPDLDAEENDSPLGKEPMLDNVLPGLKEDGQKEERDYEWVRDWLSLGNQGWNNGALEESFEARKTLPDLNIALPLEVSTSCHVLEPQFDNQDCLRVEASLPELDGAQLESMWNPGGCDSEEQDLFESGSPDEVFAGGHEETRETDRSHAADVELPSRSSGERMGRRDMHGEFEEGPWVTKRHREGGDNSFSNEPESMMAVRVSSGKVSKKPSNGGVFPMFEGMEDEGLASSRGLRLGPSSGSWHGKRLLDGSVKERAAGQSPLGPFSPDLFAEEEGDLRLNRKSANTFFVGDLAAGTAPMTPSTQATDRGQRVSSGRVEHPVFVQNQSASSSSLLVPGGGEVDLSSVGAGPPHDSFALRHLATWGLCHNSTQSITLAAAPQATGVLANGRDVLNSRANRRKQSRPQLVVREDRGRQRLSPGESSQWGSHAPAVPAPSSKQKVDVSTSSSLNLQPEDGPLPMLLDQGYDASDVRDPGAAAADKNTDAFDNCALSLGGSGPDERELIESDPNHPSHLPEGSLLQSCYLVLLEAGVGGLSSREVVSKIMDRGLSLGDPEQGLPRIQVSRALKSSPYFMDIGERFALCSAFVSQDGVGNKPAPSAGLARKTGRAVKEDLMTNSNVEEDFMMERVVLDIETEEEDEEDEEDEDERGEEEGGEEIQEELARKTRWAGRKGGFGGTSHPKQAKQRQVVATDELTEGEEEVEEEQRPREMGRGKRISKKKKLWEDCEKDTIIRKQSSSTQKLAKDSRKRTNVVVNLGTTARSWEKNRKEKDWASASGGGVHVKEVPTLAKVVVSEGESKLRASAPEKGPGGMSRGDVVVSTVHIKLKELRQLSDKELDQAVRVASSAYRLYKRQRTKLEKEMKTAEKRPRQEERETLARLKTSEAENKREMQRLDREKEAREAANRANPLKERDGSANFTPPNVDDRNLCGKSGLPDGQPVAAKQLTKPHALEKKTNDTEKKDEGDIRKGLSQAEGEAPKRCARRDNKGWVCPMLADSGRYFCAYHIERERMERERRRLKHASMKPAPRREKVGKFGKKGPTWLPRISKGLGVNLPHKQKVIVQDPVPDPKRGAAKRKSVPETGFNALVAKRAALLLGASKTMALLGGQKSLSHIEADSLMGRPGPVTNSPKMEKGKPNGRGRGQSAPLSPNAAPSKAPGRKSTAKGIEEDAPGGSKKKTVCGTGGAVAVSATTPGKGKPGRRPGYTKAFEAVGGALVEEDGARVGRARKRSTPIVDISEAPRAKRTKRVEDCTVAAAAATRGKNKPKQKQITQAIGEGRGKRGEKAGGAKKG
eukprot:TRINITY_DN2084_c0_g2_i1.p1 TRINITY_DN2084_c0_g2~~TRINITY_DN2084_c0_g2_i1.p1  ORF type:complete len:1303 (+),score=321.92 TRINITY_DN2084_c0_g2_i1:256-4164(+)